LIETGRKSRKFIKFVYSPLVPRSYSSRSHHFTNLRLQIFVLMAFLAAPEKILHDYTVSLTDCKNRVVSLIATYLAFLSRPTRLRCSRVNPPEFLQFFSFPCPWPFRSHHFLTTQSQWLPSRQDRDSLFSVWQQQLLCSAKLAFRYFLSLSVVVDRAVARVGFAFRLGRSVYCSFALLWG